MPIRSRFGVLGLFGAGRHRRTGSPRFGQQVPQHAADDQAGAREHEAVERFAVDGNRPAFMEALLGLGVAPAHIHWHVANPGRLMAGVQFD